AAGLGTAALSPRRVRTLSSQLENTLSGTIHLQRVGNEPTAVVSRDSFQVRQPVNHDLISVSARQWRQLCIGREHGGRLRRAG
ncbi:hypothetical protein, partial [Frankia sp. CiP3]|uniref:hypothetical protein n=1 Tax=Frankia sp. CiP3 TaxID=2880971 RepID=UPI001EF4A921